MFSASAWAIAIQFVFAPILSRIYAPEAYGIFSILNSWVVFIGIIATLSFHQAFVLPKSERKFRALLSLSIRSATAVSIITLIIILAFGPQIMEFFEVSQLGWWVYTTPVLVFLLAADQILINWAVRMKKFKEQSLYSIPVTFASKLLNVGYGFFISAGAEGLIITTLAHYGIRIVIYFTRILDKPLAFLKMKLEKEERQETAKEFSTYPKYIMWGNALNTASNYLPIILFPMILGSPAVAGLLTYATLALDLPIRLIGAGITPVFLKKAADLKNENPELLAGITWRLFKNLLLIAVAPLFVLYVFGTPLYELVFGEQWSEAGMAAEILVIYYFFRLISSPISSIFSIQRKERQLLFFQVFLFTIRALSILYGAMMNCDFMTLVLYFTLANAIAYFVLTLWIFKLLNFSLWKVAAASLISFAIVLFLAEGLKGLIF